MRLPPPPPTSSSDHPPSTFKQPTRPATCFRHPLPRPTPKQGNRIGNPPSLAQRSPGPERVRKESDWAAANGGVTNGGLRGVWPPIGRNRPFSPFFCLFTVFRRVRRAPGKSRKRRKKAFFLRYPRIFLNPHLRHSNPKLRKFELFSESGAHSFGGAPKIENVDDDQITHLTWWTFQPPKKNI